MKPKSFMKQIIQDIAFPRRTGSEGNLKAKKIIIDRFNDIASKNQEGKTGEHTFRFPKDTNRILYGVPAVFFISLLTLIGFTLMNIETPPFQLVSVALGFILLLTPLIAGRWNGIVERIIRRKDKDEFEDANLVLQMGEKAGKTLVFTAHYDSKSGTGKFLARGSALGFLALSSLLIALYAIIAGGRLFMAPIETVQQTLLLMKLNLGISILAFINCAIAALFFFLPPKNESPGVFDNASGVAVITALAEYFSEKPPENYNLWFTATAAEEEGLVGMVHFLDHFQKKLDPKSTLFINLDGVSGEGKLRIIPGKYKNTRLAKTAEIAAKTEEVPWSVHSIVPGVWLDSIPAQYRKYQAISFAHCDFGNPLFSMHSAKDDLESLSEQALDNTFRVCRKTVELLDKNRDSKE